MPPRVYNTELSPQLYSRICELRSIGWSIPRIHKQNLEIFISTIKRTLRRETSRQDNCSRPRSGAPRLLTEEQRDHLYDVAVHLNLHIKIGDLSKEVDGAVKERAIQKLMQEMVRRKWRKRQRPGLLPIQKGYNGHKHINTLLQMIDAGLNGRTSV